MDKGKKIQEVIAILWHMKKVEDAQNTKTISAVQGS